jgi:hypothetical protein
VLGYEEFGALSDPEQRGCAHSIEYSTIGMGHVPYFICDITIRTGVELVEIEGNYPSSIRVGLLS